VGEDAGEQFDSAAGEDERLAAVFAVDDQPNCLLPVMAGEVILDVRECRDGGGDVGLIRLSCVEREHPASFRRSTQTKYPQQSQ